MAKPPNFGPETAVGADLAGRWKVGPQVAQRMDTIQLPPSCKRRSSASLPGAVDLDERCHLPLDFPTPTPESCILAHAMLHKLTVLIPCKNEREQLAAGPTGARDYRLLAGQRVANCAHRIAAAHAGLGIPAELSRALGRGPPRGPRQLARRQRGDAGLLEQEREGHPTRLHGLEGLKHMATAIVPAIYDPSLADEDLGVATEEAFDLTRRLARAGVFVGISSGANLAAALQVARHASDAVIVVVFCDGGEKYLSERFWDEQGTDAQSPRGAQ